MWTGNGSLTRGECETDRKSPDFNSSYPAV